MSVLAASIAAPLAVPDRLVQPLAIHIGLALVYALGAVLVQRKRGREALSWPVVGIGASAVLVVICLGVAEQSSAQGAGAVGVIGSVVVKFVGIPLAIAGGMVVALVFVRLARFSPAILCVTESALYAALITEYAFRHW